MTTFFGNVIDMGISGTHIIKEPATEFFFYAFLMLVVIGVFVLFAMNYTYVAEEDMDDSMAEYPDDTENKSKKKPPTIVGPDDN
jgi:hypothetical protein